MSQPPFIEKLTLEGFRSIREDAIDFTNPTIIVGRNGSGKSNLLDAFAFLSECMVSPLQSVLENRGGLEAVAYRSATRRSRESIGMRVDFRLPDSSDDIGHYSFEIRESRKYGFVVEREQCVLSNAAGQRVWCDREKTAFRSNLESLRPAMNPQALAILIVGGVEEFAPLVQALSSVRVYSINPTAMREMQDPDSGQVLRRDGSNIASVLLQLGRRHPEAVDRIHEILTAIAPSITRVRPVRRGKRLSLELTQQQDDRAAITFEATEIANGILHFLGILTAVMQQPPLSVIALEEPEITIHTSALGTVLDLIQLGAERSQVVVTTHSPGLLDAKWIGPENLRVTYWENGATRILRLGTAAAQALDERLMGAGELLSANALDSELSPGSATPALFDLVAA
jgi:predicted ATPase